MAGSSSPKSARRYWYWLLALPIVAVLFPDLYASGPALFGIPFFYWYQIAWILLSGVTTGIVYYASR